MSDTKISQLPVANAVNPGSDFLEIAVANTFPLTGYTSKRVLASTLASAAGGVTDGNKGDVTVSGFGSSWSINTSVISAFGRTVTAALDAVAARLALGLGSLATQNGTFSGSSSGTNTGDQTSIVGITGTKAQFNTAVTDGDIVYVGDTIPASSVTGLAASATTDTTNATNITTGTLAAARLPAFGSGDVSFAAAGGTGTIAANAVTNAKSATMAAGTVKANTTAGAANPADVTLAAFKASLLISSADVSGLGALATASSVNLTTQATGTLQAAQEPAHTGDVTNTAGSLALTIANNAVTNAKAAQMAASTIKGNNTGVTANALDLTPAQTKALLAIANTDVSGLGTLATASSVNLTTQATGTLQAAQEPAHTGDVTNTAGSLALTIAANAVTNAKAAQMAASTIKGNNTGVTANAADLTAAQTKALLAITNTDVSGLGTLATQSGTFSGTSSGTNTGDQTITLTGDVTGSGTGSFAATIAAAAVTLAKMANVATGTVFYRKTAATGAPEVQTLATLKTDLGLTGTNSGDQTITLTGDATGSGTGSFATTLATVNATTGSFGLAASVAQFTVNAKGLLTAAANVAISIASTAISDATTAGRSMLTAATAAAQTALLNSFVGDAGAGGTKGLVPAPVAGDASKALFGDGTFKAIPGGGDALVANPLSQFAQTSSAQLRATLSDETGTGLAYFQGGDIGTPSAGVATNLTGTAAGLTAGNVTTNANLTGPITSTGNATAIASQTGTGTKFVVDTSPTLVTPNIGAATGVSVTLTASANPLSAINTAASTQNVVGILQSLRAAPAANDQLITQFFMNDNAAAAVEVCRFQVRETTVTAAAVASDFALLVRSAGALMNTWLTTAAAFAPFVSGALSLGTGLLPWSDFFQKTGGKLDWGNGNVTLLHSAGKLSTTGALVSTLASGGVGYATGAGGTVTQATSKATGVTLSKVCGQITLNAAALAASTTVSFVLTNTAIAVGDVLVLNHVSGGTPGSYTLNARAAAGSATIDVRNVSLASLSEAIVIGFAVVKAATA